MEASRSKSKVRHRRRRKTAESEGQVASTLYKVPANGGISERSGVTVAHRRYLSPTRASRRGVRVPRAHARTKGVLRALTCPLRVEVPWDLRTRESLDTVSAMESGGSLTAQSAFIVSRLGQEWPANRGPRWGRGRCNGDVSLQTGGGGGIRTHERVTPLAVFKSPCPCTKYLQTEVFGSGVRPPSLTVVPGRRSGPLDGAPFGTWRTMARAQEGLEVALVGPSPKGGSASQSRAGEAGMRSCRRLRARADQPIR